MKLLARLTLTLTLPFLAACALTVDETEVRRPAPQSVAPLPGATQVALTINGIDQRPRRDRVGVKKNGYGMEMAAIVATNDVVQEVRDAVASVLASRGFRTDGRDGIIEVELSRFINDFKIGFFAGDAVADVSATLRVLDPNSRLVYGRTYSTEGRNPNIQIASGSNARIALEDGLRNLMRLISEDEALGRALLTLARAVPVPQPPATPPRRGRLGS